MTCGPLGVCSRAVLAGWMRDPNRMCPRSSVALVTHSHPTTHNTETRNPRPFPPIPAAATRFLLHGYSPAFVPTAPAYGWGGRGRASPAAAVACKLKGDGDGAQLDAMPWIGDRRSEGEREKEGEDGRKREERGDGRCGCWRERVTSRRRPAPTRSGATWPVGGSSIRSWIGSCCVGSIRSWVESCEEAGDTPPDSLFPSGRTFPVSSFFQSLASPLLLLTLPPVLLLCTFFRFGCVVVLHAACRSMDIVRVVNLFQCIIFRSCLSKPRR